MTVKLPRATIEELESLVEQLTRTEVTKRDLAMTRLADYERSGKVPIEVLLELADVESPNMTMYAISALGRNGDTKAVTKLAEMLERRRHENILILESLIDALGETANPAASKPLLELIGIRAGWKGKLFGRKGGKPEDEEAEARFKDRIALPVVRALEKIADPKAAELLGDFLSHADHLVRWHAIRTMVRCDVPLFNDKLKEMSKKDDHELVREVAEMALEKLSPLPPNLNN